MSLLRRESLRAQVGQDVGIEDMLRACSQSKPGASAVDAATRQLDSHGLFQAANRQFDNGISVNSFKTLVPPNQRNYGRMLFACVR